jgi:hypothetical protein
MANAENTEWVGLGSFVGGESQDIKYGAKYQYDYARHVDIRKSPARFSVLPGPTKTSGGVVTDLVQDMTQVPDGTRYALGDAGNIYKITTGGTWSKIGALGEAGGAGIYYRPDSDCIYITGQTKVARIKTASTTPTLDVNWFAYGVSTATTCTTTGGTSTYTTPTSVQESATNMRTFITDIEPAYRIGVKIIAKGTGNWTLTLHDDANNLLGTATLSNANITAGQINYFTFGSQIRLQVSVNNNTSTSSNGRTYHYHLTSTVADGTVATTTANSLADSDMEYWAYALVQPVNGLHPIYQFSNLTLFGNEKYVASYEPLQDNPTTSDFLRHQLQFPPGYQTNGFAQLELYAAITAERRSSSATQDFQEGKMFLWDGVSTTYNRYYDIPEGSPESIFSHKNLLSFIAGGALYQSSGGQPIKIRTIRNTDSEYSNIADSTHLNPHMITVRRGVLLIGYPTITTNTTLEHAVYGYGQINQQYPMSWSTNYTISTGTILNSGTNNLRLGMVKNYGDTLYISWRDDSTGTTQYGVDIVNNSSTPATDFQLQTLYFDNNQPYKQKLAKRALAVFDTLPAGVSLRMWYMLDNGTKVYSTDDGTSYVTSGNVVQINIPKQFIGIQVGVEGTLTGTTTPICRGIFIGFDPKPMRAEISQ